MVGDRVMISPESPRVRTGRRAAKSEGTVTQLGCDLCDPMPDLVFVDWDDEIGSTMPTSDTMLSDLILVKRGST